jgi:hypothetical protein
MSVSELRAARPHVFTSDSLLRDRPTSPSLQEGRHVVVEYLDGDIERLQSPPKNSCSYTLEDGKCVSIAVAFILEWAKFPAERDRFVRDYVERLGPEFRRAVRRTSGGGFRCTYPCLVWELADCRVFLTATPAIEGIVGIVPDSGGISVMVEAKQLAKPLRTKPWAEQYIPERHAPLFRGFPDGIGSEEISTPEADLQTRREGSETAGERPRQPGGSTWAAAALGALLGAVAASCAIGLGVLVVRRRKRRSVAGHG